MESMLERLEKLKSDGYVDNLVVRKGQVFTSKEVALPKKNLSLDSTYRIESDSDSMHSSIIYALSCKDPEVKGVLINSYGIYSESDSDEVIKDIAPAVN